MLQQFLSALMITLLLAATPAAAGEWNVTKDTGYRGIWYYNQKTGTEYVYKYSGGLGTYCAKHIPFAVHAPAVNKTFFVYGGTVKGENTLLEMVSYFDHETGMVPRPVVLINKETGDAHDNPVISLDSDGHIWVFASSHGTGRPSYIFKSRKPYDIEAFEMVLKTNFSYPQPWYIADKGFLFLHTYYKGGRGLNWYTSRDGANWTERTLLAHIEHGHYQISWPDGDRAGTAFNYHPLAFNGDKDRSGLNWRTNLYYIETRDMGETWTTITGEELAVPLKNARNPALIREYEKEGRLVYMKDLKYDRDGHPVILHVTSNSWEPGPDFGPREWTVAHWTGSAWKFHVITTSDNNYDTGNLFIGEEGIWRVIGPTETGPQPFNPGGEIAVWLSSDQGKTWNKKRQLTADSEFNHTYARPPVNAHPGFCAFWADGHGRQPSISRLYFYDCKNDTVYRLPYEMEGDMEKPEAVSKGSAEE
jgi:hypothetical protein